MRRVMKTSQIAIGGGDGGVLNKQGILQISLISSLYMFI